MVLTVMTRESWVTKYRLVPWAAGGYNLLDVPGEAPPFQSLQACVQHLQSQVGAAESCMVRLTTCVSRDILGGGVRL